MNTPARVLATIAFLAAFARADEASYAGILKERDSVLSEILADREGRFARGLGAEGDVLAARMALWSFRRDTAAAKSEKIKQQQLIVTGHEKLLAAIERQAKTGIGGREPILLAKDALLQARQLLEELQRDKG